MTKPCSGCPLRLLCLASCELAQPEVGGAHKRRIAAGDPVFRKGDRLEALRAVRAGAVKSCALLAGGERRVIGYHIGGDVIGLDALGSRVHPTEASAIVDSEICEIPIAHAEELMGRRESVASALRGLLSDQIARDGERIASLSAHSARQRVAAFLLELAARRESRGEPATRFDVSLTRKEMGSYLGLTFETVSRILSEFAARGLIAVDAKAVGILDRKALENEALGAGH